MATDLGRLAYTPAEVARACGLSRTAIYRLIESGELRASRVCGGSRLLITAEDVDSWMQASVVRRESLPGVGVDLAPRRAAGRPLRDALREACAA